LRAEIFGPATVVIRVRDSADLARALDAVEGNLTATVHGAPTDRWLALAVDRLVGRVGRIVYGGVPTGVAVDRAMHHGGPYPASSSSLHTSVGDDAIKRFMRPLAYQDFPDALLPAALRA
jgi:NADP-dependent aldehyde dehydrogenase